MGNPRDVEVVRAALAAFSRGKDGVWVGVYTGRIHSFASRYSIAIDRCDEILDALLLLQEVERLPGGYWLPAPLRIVPLESCYLVLSHYPTEQLATQYPIAVGLGLARKTQVHVQAAQTQSLAHWLRAPADSIRWTENLLNRAEREQVPFIGTCRGRLLAYQKDQAAFRWTPGMLPDLLPRDGRWHLSDFEGSSEKILLKKTTAGEVAQCEILKGDARRLRFSLPALSDRPVTLTVNAKARSISIFGGRLPDAERRLMTGVTNIVTRDHFESFEYDDEILPTIKRSLSALGIKEVAK